MKRSTLKVMAALAIIAPVMYGCAYDPNDRPSAIASLPPPPPEGYSPRPVHAHWGWFNGRDASAGYGWMDDATGQPVVTGSADDRPPGYHWGWLNGRDASAGEGWISDATGRPL